MHVQFRPLILSISLAVTAFSPAIAQDAADPALKQSAIPARPYGIITTIAGDGKPGYFGNNILATQAQLDDPAGIAVDAHGNLYVADYENNMIRMVSASSGEISTVAGTVEAGYSGDHGPAKDALLSCPNGIAVDSKGNIFFSDACNNVVRKIDAATGVITTVAGYPYMTGNDPWCQFEGDGGLATKAQLCYPSGLAVDGAGNLYIDDAENGLVRRVSAASNIITTIAGNPYESPASSVRDGVPATSISMSLLLPGIAVDSKGNLYVSDSCLVLKVEASTGLISIIAGKVFENQTYCGYAGNGIPATSSPLLEPSGIAIDSDRNLFIADAENRLIVRVDATTGELSIVAGDLTPYLNAPFPGTFYSGIKGYTGDGGSATVARMDFPYAIAVDNKENLYIGDTGNQVIRKVNQTLSRTTPSPVITPAANGSGYGFAESVKVTLSDKDSAAKIYFTTDGTTPTTSSRLYDGPITLDKTSSVIAFATSKTAADSYAAQGNYFRLPAPVISPDGGSFTKPQSVVIEAPPSVQVYVTTDGSNPCTSKSRQYFNYAPPIDVSYPQTIEAVETLGGSCGAIASATFVIPSAPAVTVGSATNVTETTATLNGTINPGTFATTYQFSYSSTCSLSTQTKTAEFSLPAGTKTRSVSANISGLTPGIEYCFQLTATNRDGSSTTSGEFGTE